MPTDLPSPEELSDEILKMCETFLTRYYNERMQTFATSDATSLWVDYNDMYQYDVDFAEDYERQPTYLRKHLRRVAASICERGYCPPVRVYNLPDERDVGEYQPDDISTAIAVDGQVSQTSRCQPELKKGVYECQRCGCADNVIPQSGDKIQEPHECVGCERQGPFVLDHEVSDFVQCQTVRLQQPPEKTHGGASHIDVRFRGDIAGALRGGGERVVVNGDLDIKDNDESRRMFEYELEADTYDIRDGSYTDISIDEHREAIIEIANSEDPIQRLVNSVAPHISRDANLTAIMEAAVLQMVGTNSKDVDSAASYRGDWHMLVLGDPGTAKSEILEEVESLAPRAKFKSGKGVSKAGMSAAAVPDDFGPSKWSLKAGLLVLANNGIACLDEIDKVDPEALNAAHSALENQRVSITKAGIDADLPSRTSLLAAGNPRDGRFDQYEPIPEQIDLPPSLLSRFDLIFLLKDNPDESRDAEIASHVTRAWSDAGRMAAGEDVSESPVDRDIPAETFTAYVATARQEVTPTIPEDILTIAEERFVELRTANGDKDDSDRVPVTPRKLEAILRLAESSARARFSQEVTEADIDRAYRLVRRSMQQVGVDPETGELDADVLTTGASRTQNKRRSAIRSVLKDTTEPVPFDDLVSMVDGFDAVDIRKELDNHFLEKGIVYEPQDACFMWT